MGYSSANRQSELVGAIDIGGTKTLVALVSSEGAILARSLMPTEAGRGVNDLLGRIVDALRGLAAECRISLEAIRKLGCSVPGPLDRARGIVRFSPNLGWRDVPLVALLQERLSMLVEIEDDAHCAALGEVWMGAARALENVVYVTISTGIGGGIIIGGRLYRGAHGYAGEIGHMTLEAEGPSCACGNRGCFEALASGTAIAQRARQAMLGEDHVFVSIPGEYFAQLSARHVVQAADQGDNIAIQTLQICGRYAGIGLAAVASAFDPQAIIVGGGVADPRGIYWQAAQETFASRVLYPLAEVITLAPAALGDASALYGAAALVVEEVSNV
jgi:glucokinase